MGYLREMRDLRAAASQEVSYYPALKRLIDALGEQLKPKVRAVLNPSGAGEGIPDFGLYTETQLRRAEDGSEREKPDRGAVEVKGLAADIDELLASEQVKKYVRACGIVLATNYREFALAEMKDGQVVEIVRYTVAKSEDEFWEKAARSQTTTNEDGEKLCEFLCRALTYNVPINSAKDVAVQLASFARETLAIINDGRDIRALNNFRAVMEVVLDMKFEGEDGTHFFHSTLAQTIFYGLFAAWLETRGVFGLDKVARSLKTPVMSDLFHEISSPERLGALGLEESLDGAIHMLNRVQDKEALFAGMDTGQAMQHFYEPFLEAFDPELRRNLGVWYTPPEIVRYMVERADRVLREELKIEHGLADDSVYVLDPCGGTGAYVAEVLSHIHKTCQERGDGALAASAVKTAAQKRVFGFEIIPASYVISHWRIGTLLTQIGAPLGKDERAAIYLTNSLTNWTDSGKQIEIPYPGIKKERDAANKIKHKKQILVVIGNPPYNAYNGTSPEEEEGLVAPYREGLRELGIRSGNINDLYVRFFRMAENRIAKTGQGIVSFISNYSYTEMPLFTVMRQSLLKNFDKIWVDSMNGDSRRTGKKTPEGLPDPSIFSTPSNREGIRVGTVVGTFVRKSAGGTGQVLFRDFWGVRKREELEESLDADDFDSQYEISNPQEWTKFSFRPMQVSDTFEQWVAICDLHGGEISPGLKEGRRGALIDSSREILDRRMRDYFNPSIDWESYKQIGGRLAKNASRFNAQEAREKAIKVGFDEQNIVDHTMRPLDDQFCYYTDIRSIWNERRPKLWKQFNPGNSFFISRPKNPIADEGAPVLFSTSLVNYDAMVWSNCIPFYSYNENTLDKKTRTANLSEKVRKYLRKLKFPEPDESAESAEIVWLHALAVCYSTLYQSENVDGLKIGWPRIPLPKSAKLLRQSAALGTTIRDLLDMRKPLNLKTVENVPLNKLAVFSGDGDNLRIADGWGHMDDNGKVYPGKGKVKPMIRPPQYPDMLGAPLEVHLNDDARLTTVPERAWEYRIGGFQCAKKWLSYRSHRVLRRDLYTDEVITFAEIIRRISALVLREKSLDRNYSAMKNIAE